MPCSNKFSSITNHSKTLGNIKDYLQKSDTYNLGLTYTKYICKITYHNDKNTTLVRTIVMKNLTAKYLQQIKHKINLQKNNKNQKQE
jgi:hypothetical protein